MSGNFFFQKSTIGTTIAAIEANKDTYCLQKRIENFPLTLFGPIEIHTQTQSTKLLLPPYSKSQLQVLECSDAVGSLDFVD